MTDTGTAALTNANVEVQVFNSAGNAVSTNVWSGQNFTGGQSQQYTYTWNVPASQATGTYTVMIGVFDAAWATNYYWNSNGATITVTAGQSAPAAPTGLAATPGNGQVALYVDGDGRRGILQRLSWDDRREKRPPRLSNRHHHDQLYQHGSCQRQDLLLHGGGGECGRHESHVERDLGKAGGAATNVTSLLKITSTSFVFNKTAGWYHSTVTVENASQQSIAGPLQLVLSNLPAGVTLFNATGTTGGSPYITISSQALAAGHSASVKIEIQAASASAISYTPVVYSGSF